MITSSVEVWLNTHTHTRQCLQHHAGHMVGYSLLVFCPVIQNAKLCNPLFVNVCFSLLNLRDHFQEISFRILPCLSNLFIIRVVCRVQTKCIRRLINCNLDALILWLPLAGMMDMKGLLTPRSGFALYCKGIKLHF